MEVLATVASEARLLVAVYDDLLLWPATAASTFERRVWCTRAKEPRGTVGSRCAKEPLLLVV